MARTLRDLALGGLKDENAQVRRNAAEALARHLRPGQHPPSADLRQSAATDDSHLIHVVRMALRDQFRAGLAWEAFAALPRNPRDESDVADIATGVPSAASAHFLLDHIRRVP